jgi:hypothetical protein
MGECRTRHPFALKLESVGELFASLPAAGKCPIQRRRRILPRDGENWPLRQCSPRAVVAPAWSAKSLGSPASLSISLDSPRKTRNKNRVWPSYPFGQSVCHLAATVAPLIQIVPTSSVVQAVGVRKVAETGKKITDSSDRPQIKMYDISCPSISEGYWAVVTAAVRHH